MKVSVFQDDPGYVGGAELTMREFITAAPPGLEVGEAGPEGDVAIVGNCALQGMDLIPTLRRFDRVLRYFNDVDPHSDPDLRSWFLENAICVFTSPLHIEAFGERHGVSEHDGQWFMVPPAMDLESFVPSRQVSRNGHRSGACCIGAWHNRGKGQLLLKEWSDAYGEVDVYGDGPFVPHGPNLNVKGPVPPEQVAQTLWGYTTFVFLPTEVEPFGRGVIEAWAAGCTVVTNQRVGAMFWVEHPQGLESSAEAFWALALSEKGASHEA